jgi:TPR repeat protein
MYGFGQGVPKDLAKAESLWRRAAERGLGTAMGNIGSLYLSGQGGLPQSDVLAAEWYTKAAEHRHTPSMRSMYMNGAGVPRDAVRGLTWAGLAAGNATDPRIREMADAQMRKIASVLTREDIVAADRLSKELGPKIDANVAKYRAQ